MMELYYTIYLGDDIWQNITDDINTREIWTQSGMIWKLKKQAMACMKNLKKYNFETKTKKFSVRPLTPIYF